MKKGKLLFILVILLVLFGCGNNHEGEAKVISESSWKNTQYKEVVEKFKEAGFKNIETEGLGNLIFGFLHEEGETDEVIIEGYEEYPSGKWIDPNTKILIQYYSYDKIDNEGNVISNIEESQNEKQNNNKQENNASKNKYDIDQDVILAYCEVNDKYSTQYDIVFMDETTGVTYAIEHCVNPRAMGKKFNAIGDLPSWFSVGETVHLKANLNSDGSISTSGLEVTEPTGENNSSKSLNQEKTDNSIPVIKNVYLDDVVKAAKKAGTTELMYESDLEDGTMYVSCVDKDQAISLDLVYKKDTEEIVTASIYTNLYASDSEQKNYIITMSKVLCPPEDADEVSNWVASNIGKEKTNNVNGIDYKLWIAQTSGCLLYDVNMANWEKWATN